MFQLTQVGRLSSLFPNDTTNITSSASITLWIILEDSMIIELNISDSAPDTASIKPTSSSSASSSGTGPTLLSEFELRRCVVRIRLDATTGQLSSQPILDSDDALLSWIHCLELAFKDSPIPQSQWSDAMILFLEGPVNMEMRKRRQARRELGWSIWNWEDFVASLREVVGEFGFTLSSRSYIKLST